jgi:hypothetical protein
VSDQVHAGISTLKVSLTRLEYVVCRKRLKILRLAKYYRTFHERLHSFPRDQLNKCHGGHVGVLAKRQKSLVKIILNWNTNIATVTSCSNALSSDSMQISTLRLSSSCQVQEGTYHRYYIIHTI